MKILQVWKEREAGPNETPLSETYGKAGVVEETRESGRVVR